MNLSYWEKKSWFLNIDFCIVGSGIVGLNCALHLKDRFPKAKVLVIEKGILPQGASTKNAGFACFGSVSEILADLKQLSSAQLFDLVAQRVEGLKFLIQTLGKKKLGYQHLGGYELFPENNNAFYEASVSNMSYINEMLQPIFKSDVYTLKANEFNFKEIQPHCIYNQFEAQIDTGKMMLELLKKAYKKDILVLNSTCLKSFSQQNGRVDVLANGIEFKVSQLFIATNAFTNQLFSLDVKPARNQVIITKPIKDLRIKGTFHLDRGYYYFRNIDDRILLGGGRHLDLDKETTSEFGLSKTIQTSLEQLLRNTILPDQAVEIERRWSGILGIGDVKQPIVKSVSDRVHCGVRLGGMGIAIGSHIGKRLAGLI